MLGRQSTVERSVRLGVGRRCRGAAANVLFDSAPHWSTICIEQEAGHRIPPFTGQEQYGASTPWQSWNDASSAVSVREASNNAIWLFGVGERGFGCKSGHVHERLHMDSIFMDSIF